MTNTPLEHEHPVQVTHATLAYLRCIEDAIEHAELNLSKLKAVRSVLKTEIIGNNLPGMKKVLDGAGPPLDQKAVNNALKEVEDYVENLTEKTT